MGPFLTMVFLFLIVGFLTTANTQFQGPLKETFLMKVGNLKNTFATLITFSWFLAYPICGSIGSSWISKYGYKGTLIRGLWVMIIGLGLFFASSYFTVQFPDVNIRMGESIIPIGFFIFLLGSFVVGASATILQVVINPYLTACRVKGTQAIQRLAIGGTANSVGTTIAPYFVTGVVFGGLAMEDIQISQLMMPFFALMVTIAVVVFLLMRLSLPDIQGTRVEKGEKLEKSVWSFRHLTLGVCAIFCYVGVEVCIGANINLYAIERNCPSPALLATLYWGGMLIGRLVGSSLSRVSPRVQLTVTTISAGVLALLAIIFNNPWLLTAVGLFHSIMWGAIFTLSVAHLGKYTSVASGVFMIGVVGGAILPLLQGVFADLLESWRWSWFIVILGEVFMYIAIANAFIYLVRYGVLDWAPTYLKEVKGYDIKEIGWAYFSYEFAAIPGTIFCGWLSDKVFKGRRAITTMIYMVAVAIFVFVYWEFSKTPLMDSICLIAIGFLIYGPVMLIGVHALDLAPKKAAGTAAGFTGFFGYFFGTALFANIGLGYVVQNLGWNWNFIVLLVACALAFIFIGFTAKEEQYLVKQAKQ